MPQPPTSGCGRRPDPRTGRWPTWPATCWPAHRSLQPSRRQSTGATPPDARAAAGSPQLRRDRHALLLSNVRPAVVSRPTPRGIGRQQPKTRTRRCGRRLTAMLAGRRRRLWARRRGGRSPSQPVGQWPATDALHQVGALAQPPAGRRGVVAGLGPAGGLLQRPGGRRGRHHDQPQLPYSALSSIPHGSLLQCSSSSGLGVPYRRSRLSSTVRTTEATSENRIISRHPGQPPSGRICTRPGLMGWLLPRGLACLGADVLGALLGAVGQLLAVVLGLVLGGVGGRAGHLLGDLLAPVHRLLAGLLDLLLDLVGHRPQPLVLDPGRRHSQPGQEPQGSGPDGQPQRVLPGQPGRPPGGLLDLAPAGGGGAGPVGRPGHGLLGPSGGARHRRLDVLHLVAHRFLGSGGHIGLVANGLDGLAHLGSGLLYVFSDRIWVLAHSTSSFTVSMVCSGTGGVAALSLAWPCLTSTKAMIP